MLQRFLKVGTLRQHLSGPTVEIAKIVDQFSFINENNYQQLICFFHPPLLKAKSMYVCVCRAITERQIHSAAQEGAQSLRDLRRELGVASECGRCARCAHHCLKEAQLHPQQPRQLLSQYPAMAA